MKIEQALQHLTPRRLAILAILKSGPKTQHQVCTSLEKSEDQIGPMALFRHLQVLTQTGIVEVNREKQPYIYSFDKSLGMSWARDFARLFTITTTKKD